MTIKIQSLSSWRHKTTVGCVDHGAERRSTSTARSTRSPLAHWENLIDFNGCPPLTTCFRFDTGPDLYPAGTRSFHHLFQVYWQFLQTEAWLFHGIDVSKEEVDQRDLDLCVPLVQMCGWHVGQNPSERSRWDHQTCCCPTAATNKAVIFITEHIAAAWDVLHLVADTQISQFLPILSQLFCPSQLSGVKYLVPK